MSHKYESSYHYNMKSKEWGDFKIVKPLGLRGKTKVPYYLIRFKDTSNENEVPEHTIDRLEVVDIAQQKKLTKKRRRKKKKVKKKEKQQGNLKGKLHLNKEDKIITIDGSSQCTGYTIWENKQPTKTGFIMRLRKEEPSYISRCIYMWEELIDIIEREDIKGIFIENIILKQRHTIKTASFMNGLLVAYSKLYDIELSLIDVGSWKAYISTKTWKKGLKGTNREKSKKATIKRIKEIYNIDVMDNKFTQKELDKKVFEDMADSLAIGYYANDKKIEWR